APRPARTGVSVPPSSSYSLSIHGPCQLPVRRLWLSHPVPDAGPGNGGRRRAVWRGQPSPTQLTPAHLAVAVGGPRFRRQGRRFKASGVPCEQQRSGRAILILRFAIFASTDSIGPSARSALLPGAG